MALQQGTSIEAQVRLPRYQWVVDEASIERSVGNDEQPGLKDRMGTDRDIERRFPHPEPLDRLEPLTIAINEVDHRDGSLADQGGHLGNLIERRILGGVENLIPGKGGEPLLLVGR